MIHGSHNTSNYREKNQCNYDGSFNRFMLSSWGRGRMGKLVAGQLSSIIMVIVKISLWFLIRH